MRIFWGLILIISFSIVVSYSQERVRKPFNDLPHNVKIPNGSFVEYVLEQDSIHYFIRWGNKYIHRKLDVMKIGPASSFPYFVEYNDSVIILRAGCGMPCWYALILPLNSNNPVRKIEYPEAYDMKNNLIAYNGEADTIIFVENFLTHVKNPIIGQSCGSAFNGFCVDSISIINRQLYIRWLTEYDFNKPDREKHKKTLRLQLDL